LAEIIANKREASRQKVPFSGMGWKIWGRDSGGLWVTDWAVESLGHSLGNLAKKKKKFINPFRCRKEERFGRGDSRPKSASWTGGIAVREERGPEVKKTGP